MLLQIADILSPAECAAVRDALSDDRLWRDGAETAKGRARAAKHNRQADRGSPIIRGIAEKIERSLRANAILRAAAQPAAFARILLSRYETGMQYGAHVDAPYIDGCRTDLSFTLFLNEPADYDGGDLVIGSAGADDRIKLPAGAAVLYPSTSLHEVTPVTRGVRLAAVGWIRSRIRLAEHRALLFELETALADLAATDADPRIRDRLQNLRNNLLRNFGE